MTYKYLDKQDLNKENLISDEQFLEDAALFLEDRGGYEFSYSDEDVNEQIYDGFMEHFRKQNVNEVTATRDLFYAQTADDESQERFGSLMNAYDNMDSDFGWTAAGDYVEGVLKAPSTYAGVFSFGAAKAGSLAAQQGIKLGIRQVLKRKAKGKIRAGLEASVDGFKKGGWKTAGASALIDGAVAGYTVRQQGETREQLGIADDASLADIALAATFSAATAGTFGAITGTQKTITSNIAEQIRLSAIAKETHKIERAHKNITSKVATDAATKDTYLLVKDKLLPLIETVPEKLAEGKKLKTPGGGLASDVNFKSAKFVPTIEDKFHENIASAATLILKNVKPIVKETVDSTGKKVVQKERITSRLARGLTEGDVTDVGILKILDDHGLTVTQLTSLIVAEYSEAGRKLGRLGALKKAEKTKLLKELAEIDQKLVNLADVKTPAQKALEESEKGLGSKLRRVYTNWGPSAINKARIGLMTIQTATTARNTTNGYMRNYVYALDNVGEGLADIVKAGGQFVGGAATVNKALIKEAKRSVVAGMEKMRTGGQSAYMKDMWFGTNSWETEALSLLFRDEKFGQSDLAKTLFREMGDVGENLAVEGGIVALARKANTLNSMSDNYFKRAIFSREIDKWIRTNTNQGGLRKMFEDYYLSEGAEDSVGIFNVIFDMDGGKEAIRDAMTKALEFTYQEGKFQGKAGAFNKLADGFITAATGFIPASALVPFPRYLVNQLIFQYEHAPILGLINMGGILNKRGGEKGIRGVNVGLGNEFRLKLDSEAFGKQMSGLGVLAAFYGIRNHFGDENTGPYEFKVGGATYDLTAALGPFMGAAWFADWLYRHTGPKEQGELFGVKLPQIHNNDKVAVGVDGKARDAINAFLGGSAKGGSGLYVVDSLVDGLVNSREAGGPSDMTWQEVSARFAGDFFNSALVPFGMVKDIAGTVGGLEYRVVQDTTSVDFMEYMLNRAMRSFPDKYDPEQGDVPVYRPSRDKPLYNVNPFLKMIVGFNEQEKKTLVENELERLRFDYRQIAPRKIKGDPAFTNLAKGEMGLNMDTYILPYIMSKDYQSLKTDRQKKYFLNKKITDYRTLARTKVLEPSIKDTSSERQRKLKALFIGLPTNKRRIVEERYRKENGNSLYETLVDVDTNGDYIEGIRLYINMFGDKDFFPTKKN